MVYVIIIPTKLIYSLPCPALRDFLSKAPQYKSMLNPLYEKNPSVLLITVTALNVTLWKRLYLRTDGDPNLYLPTHKALRLLKEENHSRKEKLKEVKRFVMSRLQLSAVRLCKCCFRELEVLQVKGRKYASNWN